MLGLMPDNLHNLSSKSSTDSIKNILFSPFHRSGDWVLRTWVDLAKDHTINECLYRISVEKLE